MEAEPEMFGAAVAAPEGLAYGSFALPSTLELRTWATGSTDIAQAGESPSHVLEAEPSVDGRSSSPLGPAILVSIALAQAMWWAALAYVALRLLAL
jgi:hypothetical protein